MTTSYHGLSTRDLHLVLAHYGFYQAKISLPETSKTTSAIRNYLAEKVQNVASVEHTAGIANPSHSYARQRLAVCQSVFYTLGFYAGRIDGLYGPNTAYAIEQWQNWMRTAAKDGTWIDDYQAEKEDKKSRVIWPKYSRLEAFYGKPGQNHVTVTLPFPQKLAWDVNSKVNRITVNKHCADAYINVMNRALKDYGYDALVQLRLDLFGGCFNDRAMRGGTKKSVHAYAAAFDYDPLRNQLRWDASQASFARPEYKKWIAAWESQGARSLGVEHNFDWMHFEFCQG